jgi:hypothetical protein
LANLAETRQRFIAIAGVLSAVAVLALLYLALPFGGGKAEGYRQLDQARTEFKNVEREVLPLRGLPTKLTRSQRDIRAFYHDRLPSRYSLISDELGKVAARSGVSLADVHYETFETDLPDLEMISMSINVSGDYSRVMRFINGLERNKVFFLIDGLALADQKAGIVRLDLHLETYLRLTDEPNLGPANNSQSKKQSRMGD